MPKLKTIQDVSNTDTWEELRRYVSITLDDIVAAINGRLTFGDNVSTQVLSVTFSAANTSVTVPHTLKRVPSGYVLCGASAAMSIYNGSSANDKNNIYVKSSATGTASILVF